MSFRSVDGNIADVIKSLQSQINELRNGVGATRQNTIRLGDWVIEAITDHRLKMTNTVTKEISYAGGPSELPPFSHGGALTAADSSDYPVPFDCTVLELAVTLRTLDAETAFSLIVNGAVVYSSPVITANYLVIPVNIPLNKDDLWFCRINRTTSASDLTVVPRL
jgi:hypothetical protein